MNKASPAHFLPTSPPLIGDRVKSQRILALPTFCHGACADPPFNFKPPMTASAVALAAAGAARVWFTTALYLAFVPPPLAAAGGSYAQWQGTQAQSIAIWTKLKKSGVYLGHGAKKCAFEIPGDQLIVKFPYACCPKKKFGYSLCRSDRATQRATPSCYKSVGGGNGTQNWQFHLDKELASLMLDPFLKPELLFYGGWNATRTTMDQHFREINRAPLGPTQRSRRARDHGHARNGAGNGCHGTLHLSTEYLVNHVPYVVLRKIQTRPQCTDHKRAEQNFAKMLLDFQDNARPMIVDIDHELALLTSDCQYIYVDCDWVCYNNPGNQSRDDVTVDDPFAALRQTNGGRRLSPLTIKSCMRREGGECRGTCRDHILYHWTRTYTAMKASHLKLKLQIWNK